MNIERLKELNTAPNGEQRRGVAEAVITYLERGDVESARLHFRIDFDKLRSRKDTHLREALASALGFDLSTDWWDF